MCTLRAELQTNKRNQSSFLFPENSITVTNSFKSEEDLKM